MKLHYFKLLMCNVSIVGNEELIKFFLFIDYPRYSILNYNQLKLEKQGKQNGKNVGNYNPPNLEISRS